MDPGSQFTALRKNTAKQLSLNGPTRTLMLGTSGAQQLSLPNQTVVEFKLSSLDNSYVTDFKVEAITMPEVTCNLDPIGIDPNRYEHLKDVQFTEKLPMTPKIPRRVDLLVGEPYVSQLFENIICGRSLDEPKAAIFQIGACLTGTAPPKGDERMTILANLNTHQETPDQETTLYIQKCYNLENIGIEDPLETNQLTAEEQQAEDFMKANTYYDEVQKCWYTKLLWADSPIHYTNEKRAASTATRVIKKFSSTIRQSLTCVQN